VLDEHFDDDRIKHVLASYWSYNGQLPSTLPFMDVSRLLTLYIEFKPFQVRGGSQAMSSAMLDSFLAAGRRGPLQLRTHQGAVVGVTLDNGDEYNTRMVISNASAITTYTKMRDPDAVRRDLRGRPLGISGSMVYLGLDATPEELGFTSETNFVTSDLSERTVRESMFNLDPTPSAVATCYGDRIGHAPSRACTVALFSVQARGGVGQDSPGGLRPDQVRVRARHARPGEGRLPDPAGRHRRGRGGHPANPQALPRHSRRRHLRLRPGRHRQLAFPRQRSQTQCARPAVVSGWTTAGGYNATIVTAARFSQRLLQL